MALINITPRMTSNTTPSPYVVSASNVYSSTYDAWKAFDGITCDTSTADNAWVSANGTTTGWIMIDLGVSTRIDAFSLYTRYNDPSHMVKEFYLYGSDDNIAFTLIDSFSEQIFWKPVEARLYKLKQSVSFRYYKFVVSKNVNGIEYASIGEIKLWKDDGITSNVTTKMASLNYCLPKNSTSNMTLRSNDQREGLLGFANDTNNYGTLYMINNGGKAEIPKAKPISDKLIFNGVANTAATNYSLSEVLTNFKKLKIVMGSDNGTAYENTIIIPTSEINLTKENQFSLGYYESASSFWYCRFKFTQNNVFVINAIGTTGLANIAINKIYGIY